MSVRISEPARTGLGGSYGYLRDLNPAAAVQVVERLAARCESIERFPDRGTALRTRSGREVRRLVEAPFVIVYGQSGSDLVVFRILHGARDVGVLLNLIRDGD